MKYFPLISWCAAGLLLAACDSIKKEEAPRRGLQFMARDQQASSDNQGDGTAASPQPSPSQFSQVSNDPVIEKINLNPLKFPNDCPQYAAINHTATSIKNFCVATPREGFTTTASMMRSSNLVSWLDIANREANPMGFMLSCRYLQGPTADDRQASTLGVHANVYDDINADGKIANGAYRALAEDMSPLAYALASPDSHYLKFVLASIAKAGGSFAIPEAKQFLKNLKYLETSYNRLRDRCFEQDGSDFEAGYPKFCRWNYGYKMRIKDKSGVLVDVPVVQSDSNLNRFVLAGAMSSLYQLKRLTDPNVTNGWAEVINLANSIVNKNKTILLEGVRAQVAAYRAPMWRGGPEDCAKTYPKTSISDTPQHPCYDSGASATQYANMDLSYTVIMDFAGLLFGDADPSVPKGFAAESARMMSFVAKQLIAPVSSNEGGFHYIGNGTESPIYHTFNLRLLTEHYDLVGNGSGDTSIQNLVSAGYHYFPNNNSLEGQPESWSDIYWKGHAFLPQPVGMMSLLGAPKYETETGRRKSEDVWRQRTERIYWNTLSGTVRPCDYDNVGWPSTGGYSDIAVMKAWARYAAGQDWIGSGDPSKIPAMPGADLETKILRVDANIQGIHAHAPVGGVDALGQPLIWHFGFVTGPGGFRNTFVGGLMTNADTILTTGLFGRKIFGVDVNPGAAALRGVELEVLTSTTPHRGYWLSDESTNNTVAWRRLDKAATDPGFGSLASALFGKKYTLQTARSQLLKPDPGTSNFEVTQVWRIAGAGMIGMVNLVLKEDYSGANGIDARILIGPNDVQLNSARNFSSGPIAVRILDLGGISDSNVSIATMPGNAEAVNSASAGSKMGILLHVDKMAANRILRKGEQYRFGVWLGPKSRIANAPNELVALKFDGESTPSGWLVKLPNGKTVGAFANLTTATQTVSVGANNALSVLWCNRLSPVTLTPQSPCVMNPTGVLTLAPGSSLLLEPDNFDPW